MSLTVVGSIAYDAVKTPFGERERMLGGAATHFALAASFFGDVRAVGVVGEDFDEASWETLRTRGTNTDDVELVPGGKTFFWRGEYGWDLNTRETIDTRLNVFEHFDLRPGAFREELELHRPIYQKTAAYGHFGREDHDFTWEKTDKAAVLAEAAGLDEPLSARAAA